MTNEYQNPRTEARDFYQRLLLIEPRRELIEIKEEVARKGTDRMHYVLGILTEKPQ